MVTVYKQEYNIIMVNMTCSYALLVIQKEAVCIDLLGVNEIHYLAINLSK